MLKLTKEQKSTLRDSYRKFQSWASTTEGKTQIDDFNKKAEFFRKKFSKKNFSKLSDDDYRECWKESFAAGILNIITRDTWWGKTIKKNGSFKNLKQHTKDLLYGKDKTPERFEKALKNIYGFGDSTITEFLHHIYPKQCPIWNGRVFSGLKNLGLENILPIIVKNNPKKKLKKSQGYKECVDFLSTIKTELSKYGVKDFYDLDHFFWYYSNKKNKFGTKSGTNQNNFCFVEKDFKSTTGKKDDAIYLSRRMRTLLDVLSSRLGSDFEEYESYPNKPNRQGKNVSPRYWQGGWIGFYPKGEDKAKSIQLQVTVDRHSPFVCNVWITKWMTQKKKKEAAKIIKNSKKEFLSLLNSFSSNYSIAVYDNSKSFEFDANKVTEGDLDTILQKMISKDAEFHFGYYFTKKDTIDRGTAIVDDITAILHRLLPIHNFLNGLITPQTTLSSSILNLKRSEIEKIIEIELPKNVLDDVCAALNVEKNIILNGPPGTGKTSFAINIAQALVNKKFFALVYKQTMMD